MNVAIITSVIVITDITESVWRHHGVIPGSWCDPVRLTWRQNLVTIIQVSWIQVQCCFTSTETIRTSMDAEPRTATSTFTHLLNSEIHTTSSDGHSTFTQLLSSEILQFSVALRPQRPEGLLGTGSPGRSPPPSHSSWALKFAPQVQMATRLSHSSCALRYYSSMLLYVHRDHKD